MEESAAAAPCPATLSLPPPSQSPQSPSDQQEQVAGAPNGAAPSSTGAAAAAPDPAQQPPATAESEHLQGQETFKGEVGEVLFQLQEEPPSTNRAEAISGATTPSPTAATEGERAEPNHCSSPRQSPEKDTLNKEERREQTALPSLQSQPSQTPEAPAQAKALSPPSSSERLQEEVAEALRLKSLAEEKYREGGPLKSALKHAKRALRLAPDLEGLPQMVTALRVLRAPPGDHYRALLLDPFSHVNTVRRQYKVLALALHPDKNAASLSAFPGSEDAFKRVGEAFQVLSDRARRREYDLHLRMELEAAAATKDAVETFWTACTLCRLFHQFDRRYVGHRLLCPRCKKSFRAVEVRVDGNDSGNGHVGTAGVTSSRIRRTRSTTSAKLADSLMVSGLPSVARAARSARPVRSSSTAIKFKVPAEEVVSLQRKRKVNLGDKREEPSPKRAKEKTLAELQLELKRKTTSVKSASTRSKLKEKGKSKAIVPSKSQARDLRAMKVEDSDFYDFDKHRTEKYFRKGQVWAIYDDDDGMPRHYGLIVDVSSVSPFRVKMSWLDIEGNGDEALLAWEKRGVHISCGRFKVSRTVDIDSVNFFSHPVECERAAREVYRIFPKKGTVWALYSEDTPAGGEERHYDIVVLLTSYSEMYGLSMAFLVKVEGFKTIFKRREVGIHAVRWLEKDGTRVFSHQIPARKLSGSEAPDLPSDCWELDPASLPPHLIRIV